MTDAQLGILVTALTALGGGIGAAIRWAVLRMVKSQDAATDALIKHAEKMSDHAASNRELIGEVKEAIRRIDEIADFVEEEISGVYDHDDVRRTVRRAARERAKTPRATTERPPRPGYRED